MMKMENESVQVCENIYGILAKLRRIYPVHRAKVDELQAILDTIKQEINNVYQFIENSKTINQKIIN